MNSVFTAKLLQNLRNKKGNKGFTLIELLVVVIIIGVLAAVALPNLLAQVGKARETEGKNGVGTITRAQQTYHFEAQAFADGMDNASFASISSNPLGLAVASDYFSFTSSQLTDEDDMSATAAAPDAATASENGTRAFASQMEFDGGNYDSIMCQSNQVTEAVPTPTDVNTCATGSTEIK